MGSSSEDQDNDDDNDSDEDIEDTRNDEAQHGSTSKTRVRIPRSLIVRAEAFMK